mmetsp:Transcript_42198/g.86057  ORF Transcript_42198/g.86057 Transcript_42198/m.86057 type:complete len:86 (-) Transcript_42198:2-259(-)
MGTLYDTATQLPILMPLVIRRRWPLPMTLVAPAQPPHGPDIARAAVRAWPHGLCQLHLQVPCLDKGRRWHGVRRFQAQAALAQCR